MILNKYPTLTLNYKICAYDSLLPITKADIFNLYIIMDYQDQTCIDGVRSPPSPHLCQPAFWAFSVSVLLLRSIAHH